ncbi:MAG TPA: hypothetical protein VKP30_15475 [Polyangiaceae bacterium]|nr:hypothetical protein [Polyangiaceae bacterium]
MSLLDSPRPLRPRHRFQLSATAPTTTSAEFMSSDPAWLGRSAQTRPESRHTCSLHGLSRGAAPVSATTLQPERSELFTYADGPNNASSCGDDGRRGYRVHITEIAWPRDLPCALRAALAPPHRAGTRRCSQRSPRDSLMAQPLSNIEPALDAAANDLSPRSAPHTVRRTLI